MLFYDNHLKGWYYCRYTEEKAGFVRDFVTAQARVDIRIELRNGPRPVCFQISYSSSPCHATLPKDGDHPRISTSRCTSEGSKVPRGSGPASWTGSVYQCAVSLLQGTSLGAFFFLFLNKFQRPFYTIFIFKMSCHLEFFKIIC